MTVDAFWVLVALFVPFATACAVAVLWPREWAHDLLDEVSDEVHRRFRAGEVSDVELEASEVRLRQVSPSFAPPWERNRGLRTWEWTGVLSTWLVTRRSPRFAEVPSTVPDELDAVIGRAVLRSSLFWWCWAAVAAAAAVCRRPALLLAPSALVGDVRGRAAGVAVRHRARLELLDVDRMEALVPRWP